MPHNVEYQISLKDLLSGKVREAEGHVNHFEHTLEKTGERGKEMFHEIGAAAVGFFGLYQGVEFIKSSVEAYNNVEKSLSQLRAGLESTHGAAGVTYEELTEGAEKFASSTIYNKEVLLDMQAQLLSFPEITKEVFEDAEQAVLDLATRTGHSAHDVSIMVGKALGDPAHGVSALRRVGVEFDETQTELIKKLATTGHLVKAQQMVLKELGREYAGSTAAASATAGGQLEILKHQFDEVKESIGALVMEQTVELAPTIKEWIEDSKNAVHWIGEHKQEIITTTKAVVEITAAIWAFNKTKSVIMSVAGAWIYFSEKFISEKEAEVTAETHATAATNTGTTALSEQGAVVTVLTEKYAALNTQLELFNTAQEGALAVGAQGGLFKESEMAAMSVPMAYKAGAAEGGGAAVAGEEGTAIAAMSIPAIGEVVAGVLTVAAVVAGAVALAEYVKGHKEEVEKNNQTNDENELINKRIGHGLYELGDVAQGDKSVTNSSFFGHRQQDMFGSQYEDILEARMLNNGKKYQDMMLKHNEELFSDLTKAGETDRDLILKNKIKGNEESYQPLLEFFKKEEDKFKAEDLGSHRKHKIDDTDAKLSDNMSSVQGQTIKNYNITINGGLIHDFTVHSKSVKEAVPDIKRVVTEAMTDAINDSEINN